MKPECVHVINAQIRLLTFSVHLPNQRTDSTGVSIVSEC